jgi:VIT1/CCC1 family predicted Fe2+/Mn2+ transporter
MIKSMITGVSFGLTSGVITTLGLIVGLASGTHSRLAVIGGILTIAIADSLSDALGMHIAEEAKNTQTEKQIWISTGATFLSKLLMALTFLIPIFFFDLSTAVIVAVAWGLGVLAVMSYTLARSQGTKPLGVIGEHLTIAVVVVLVTHWVGQWLAKAFG